MNDTYQNLAVVIPSLDPKEELVSYVRALTAQGFDHIYIINDGSNESYDSIFQALSALDACTLLTHPKNRGKGAALKTAYHHIAQNFAQCHGIITADSDGQHTVKDVCQIADALLQNTEGLLLGGRDFSQPGIPPKSWLGNRCSSLIFFLLHGRWIQDTQTGLRGFGRTLLSEMCAIEGDRFQYEMAVLVTCASKKVPIHFIPIETIYIDDNSSTHFDPILDSLQIGRVLLNKLCRFMVSSGLSCIIDISLCWAFLALFTHFIPSNFLRIGLSVVLARIVSMLANYHINRDIVFRAQSHKSRSFHRYLLLAIANMVVSTVLIYGGQRWLSLDERLAKVIADTILFIVNYQIQQIWVFPNTTSGGTT